MFQTASVLVFEDSLVRKDKYQPEALLRVNRATTAGQRAHSADIVFDDFRELDQFVFSGKVEGLGRR